MNCIYDTDLIEQKIEQEWQRHLAEAYEARIDYEVREAEDTAEWLDETSE